MEKINEIQIKNQWKRKFTWNDHKSSLRLNRERSSIEVEIARSS
jgi:hypothetical protein